MNYDLTDARAILERTPRVLKTLLGDLSSEWTKSNEGGESWSPFDVVGHLIHTDETDWMPRCKAILFAEDKRFPPFDRFGYEEKSKGKTVADLLDRFEVVRAESLSELDSWKLVPAQLEMTGIHPEFGEVTLRQLLSTWVAHDLNHIGQIVRVMAKQLKEEAGPWVQYLRVLQS